MIGRRAVIFFGKGEVRNWEGGEVPKIATGKKEELREAGNRGYHCMSGLFLFFSLLSVHWTYFKKKSALEFYEEYVGFDVFCKPALCKLSVRRRRNCQEFSKL